MDYLYCVNFKYLLHIRLEQFYDDVENGKVDRSPVALISDGDIDHPSYPRNEIVHYSSDDIAMYKCKLMKQLLNIPTVDGTGLSFQEETEPFSFFKKKDDYSDYYGYDDDYDNDYFGYECDINIQVKRSLYERISVIFK